MCVTEIDGDQDDTVLVVITMQMMMMVGKVKNIKKDYFKICEILASY
jgi:hypothetical protein